MDFALIKEHPLITGGVVIGGAIVVYLLFSGGSSTSTAATAAAAQPTGYIPAVDPNANAINAQLTEAQLSSQTQLGLASDSVQLGSLQSNNALTLGLNQSNNALAVVNSDNTTQQDIYDHYFASLQTIAQSNTATPTPVTSVSSGAPDTTTHVPPYVAPTSVTPSYDINNPSTYGAFVFPAGSGVPSQPIGVITAAAGAADPNLYQQAYAQNAWFNNNEHVTNV